MDKKTSVYTDRFFLYDNNGIIMPKELKPEEVTDGIIDNTIVLRKKGAGDFVKFKLRTKKTLYTVKVPMKEADSFEKKILSRGSSIEVELV